MLEDKDLQKIGHEVGKIIEQNVNPQFDEIRGDINEIRGDIKGMKSDIKEVKSSMATKGYLDDKFADLEGGVIARQKKQDQKVNTLVNILKERDLINEQDIKRLKEFRIFPSADELV